MLALWPIPKSAMLQEAYQPTGGWRSATCPSCPWGITSSSRPCQQARPYYLSPVQACYRDACCICSMSWCVRMRQQQLPGLAKLSMVWCCMVCKDGGLAVHADEGASAPSSKAKAPASDAAQRSERGVTHEAAWQTLCAQGSACQDSCLPQTNSGCLALATTLHSKGLWLGLLRLGCIPACLCRAWHGNPASSTAPCQARCRGHLPLQMLFLG